MIVVRFREPHPEPGLMIPSTMFGDDGIEMPFDPTTGAADSDAMAATFLRGGRLQRR